MKLNVSKRASILKRVLKFINVNQWEDYGSCLTFGPLPPFYELDEDSQKGYARSDPNERRIREFIEAVSECFGEKLSAERTALTGRPDRRGLLREKLRALPEDYARQLVAATEAVSRQAGGRRQSESSVLDEDGIDALDGKYAGEVLEKLDLVVSRVSRLEALRLERIPNKKVSRSFEEAMKCYLYGFDMACAAMCRALVEASLKEVIDPKEQLRPTKEERENRKRGASYFLKLVDNARWSGKLSKALSEETGPADQVKEAGDAAVHDPAGFATQFPAEKVESLLDGTRQIVMELYGGA